MKYKITKRQNKILLMLINDQSYKSIADALGLSLNTIEKEIVILKRQFGVRKTYGLVAIVLLKTKTIIEKD